MPENSISLSWNHKKTCLRTLRETLWRDRKRRKMLQPNSIYFFLFIRFIFSLLRQCAYSKYSVVSINKLWINQIENHTQFLMHKAKWFYSKSSQRDLIFLFIICKNISCWFSFLNTLYYYMYYYFYSGSTHIKQLRHLSCYNIFFYFFYIKTLFQ